MQQRPVQRVAAASCQAKFNSKAEVYGFLTVEVKAYLPPPDCVTIYWLKQLIAGERVRLVHEELLSSGVEVCPLRSDQIHGGATIQGTQD